MTKKFNMSTKKLIYISIALFIAIIGIIFFVFIMNFKLNIEEKYFSNANTDLIEVSRYDFLNDFLTLILQYILTFMLIFAFSFLFAFYLYKLFSIPLNTLRDAMREIRTDYDFEVRIPVKGLKDITMIYNEFNSMIKACQKKISVTHYVSESTEKMIANLKTGEISTQPRRKDVTIFFSDVRGFTSFSEKHDPLDVIVTINDILSLQIEIITKYQGSIDKFIGDEIMAEFYEPAMAFKAAGDIQKKMNSFNKRRKEPLPLGIGIHCGEAVVGAIGSGCLYDWTIIGNTVNTGRRLCGAAEPGTTLISEAAFLKIKTKKHYNQNEIKVKGLSQKIKVYIFGESIRNQNKTNTVEE